MAKLFSSSSLSLSWAAGAAVARAGLGLMVVCLLCWAPIAMAMDEDDSVAPPEPTRSENVFDQLLDNMYNVKEIKQLEDAATPIFPQTMPPPPEMTIQELNTKNIARVQQKYEDMVSSENKSKDLFKAMLGTGISAGVLALLGSGLALHARSNDLPIVQRSQQQESNEKESQSDYENLKNASKQHQSDISSSPGKKTSGSKFASRVVGALFALNLLAAAGTGIAQHVMAKRAAVLGQQLNRSIHALNQVNKLHRISKGLEDKKESWEEFDYSAETAK